MDNKNVTLYGMENDMALLQFLRSKNTERFTKLDAFCYLIGKMSGQDKAHKGDSSKDISPLCHGEFTGSISELANDWHWHRATVRSFLDGLENLGVIKRKLQGRDYTFTLRTHASLTVPIITYDTVLEVAYLLLQHWDEYNLSPEFLAAYFEAYDGTMNDEDDCGDPDWNKEDQNAKIVLECFSHLEFSTVYNCQDSDSLVQMVASTFKGAGQWSWTKWMQALMYMDFVLMGEDFPDIDKSDEDSYKHNAFVCDFSKQDMRLLRELFYKLKKMEKNNSEQTDSNHTSSSLTSQDNE
ncbi:MAG: hypothetical protein Q4A50_01935 [Bacteroidales bacterium]|nr:hypothetical protein [Bacteroidales bacterium]